MAEILTFSQCLKRLMQHYQFSATSLISMIGCRTELKRVLANDGTEACRNTLFEKMKSSHLFSAEDYTLLEHSLKVSRIGQERYRFSQQMKHLVEWMPAEEPAAIHLEGGSTLQQRLSTLMDADKIEIICVNCCYSSVIQAVKPFFDDPERDVMMWHILHADAFAPLSSLFLSVAHPLLFDTRYQPYGMKPPLDTKLHVIGGNLFEVRAHYPARTVQLCFLMLDEKSAIEMPNATESNIFSFLAKALHYVGPALYALKKFPVQNDDYSALCMSYLSYELNRCTYSVSSDLCFYQTPTDIALAALHDNASFSQKDMASLLERVVAIHEQRYQNYYTKRKDTYQVMTYCGCKRFLETGMFTDHFFGFRAFTPHERKIIFGNMLTCAKENAYYVPLLLKEHDFQFRYNLFCYEKIGVCLDKADNDYNLDKGLHSVFVNYPEFTQQYTQYYLDTLTTEMCHTPEESLRLMEEIYAEFLVQNDLTE